MTLTFDLLTLNVCTSVSAVTCSNSVSNVSEIKRPAAELKDIKIGNLDAVSHLGLQGKWTSVFVPSSGDSPSTKFQ